MKPKSIDEIFAEHKEFVKGFCPTGEGGGIDNSCGRGKRPTTSTGDAIEIGATYQDLESGTSITLVDLDDKDGEPVVIGTLTNGDEHWRYPDQLGRRMRRGK